MTTRIITDHWLKPIPDRQFDWEATYDGYEGGNPIGYGKTEQQAVGDLINNYPREEGQS